ARIAQARQAAEILGEQVSAAYPFAGTTKPMSDDRADLVLNRTWRPQLAVIGGEGLTPVEEAGNVLLPYTKLKLSLRLPPTLDGKQAVKAVTKALNAAAPNDAEVEVKFGEGSTGWSAPELAPWLETSLMKASTDAFGKPPAYMGEGGSIPFMAMLGEKFPGVQFVITGVLGPHSNAHGPNEFLHIPTGKRVTMAMAQVIADHFNRPK
ncbi:MAG: peptidase dimerization domain-containing protein, partial [Alphaproteobacteria bacterium]|nr:peptidase dimerization domain-containing protein [Alphaproteobacteria bacterium]